MNHAIAPDATQAPAEWTGEIVSMGEPYEPAPTTDADLARDPEPDSITHGLTLRLHRTGRWAVLIHGEYHRFFYDFEDAKAYMAAAEAEWHRIADTPYEPNAGHTLDGHPAWEGGAE